MHTLNIYMYNINAYSGTISLHRADYIQDAERWMLACTISGRCVQCMELSV